MQRPSRPLEAIVAHGARMSWAGLLRPRDAFALPARSRRVLLTAEDGGAVERYYGAWSARYRRFTSNLSTPKVRVRVLSGPRTPSPGVEALVHWVDRREFLRGGGRGVPAADGWPPDLWEAFLADHDRRPGASLAEKLHHFARLPEDGEPAIVRRWRRLLRGSAAGTVRSGSVAGLGWVPVPVRILDGRSRGFGFLSWSPSPLRCRSLSEALARRGGPGPVDLDAQTRYYLEVALGRLHGVEFSGRDALLDPAFERSRPYRRLAPRPLRRERERIEDPALGRLDRRG